MTYVRQTLDDDLCALPQMPGWAPHARAETPEDLAFRSGAALLVLDQLVSTHAIGVPVKLLANRLAVGSATATSKLEGRLAREADIRDAFLLTPPGDDGRHMRGPDGELLAFWRHATRHRLRRADPEIEELIGPDLADEARVWLRDGQARARTHGPLAGCVTILRSVLAVDDRAERVACLLSDITLARALDWKTVLPVTACRLTKTHLRNLNVKGQGVELAVQTAILQSVSDTIQLARDLGRRADALRAVAPKLRAKGSEAAVALFLAEDAVVPSSMLSPRIQGTSVPMTARAARRFCDRLVELGVARELTGRSTFRLYGL